MKKLLLLFNGVKAEASYNDDEMLTSIIIHSSPGKDVLGKFLLNMPLGCNDKWMQRLPGIKAEPMAADLSFARFWAEYGYRVGKKPRAEKLWDTLSPADRQRAIDYIGQYNAHLITTNQNKLYPETYLSQERWNN